MELEEQLKQHILKELQDREEISSLTSQIHEKDQQFREELSSLTSQIHEKDKHQVQLSEVCIYVHKYI